MKKRQNGTEQVQYPHIIYPEAAMSAPQAAVDCKNQTVAVGDIVRVVNLDKRFIKSFPEDERILIESMIGQFFKVIAMDEEGQPCVMREWHDERGIMQTHVIALDAEDMEKI
ncbi:hypothetical protein [Undibacterium umbellatum]|uniref:Uncharacterized protein n=1 Tax=Undibacterium umbellatum TaxID=2762300 RepID=A0ABR6ZDW1_9BURK|nr:hypothetical protein [Undibacterium umbellatum]MBC3909934.1 hypothetical protein [Undibacterium umbellatum]